MWGEGASDLWGHLEAEDAAGLEAVRERMKEKSVDEEPDENGTQPHPANRSGQL